MQSMIDGLDQNMTRKLENMEKRITDNLKALITDTVKVEVAKIEEKISGKIKTEVIKVTNENIQAEVKRLVQFELAEINASVVENRRKILELDVYGRKYQINIKGIPQTDPRETNAQLEAKVRAVFTNNLQLNPDAVNSMYFRAVHRVGKREDANKLTVVVLNNLDQVSDVFRNAYRLKDSHFSVNSSLPKELQDYKSDLLFKRKALKEKKNINSRVVERRGFPQLEKLLPKATPASRQEYEVLEKFDVKIKIYEKQFVHGQCTTDDVDLDSFA